MSELDDDEIEQNGDGEGNIPHIYNDEKKDQRYIRKKNKRIYLPKNMNTKQLKEYVKKHYTKKKKKKAKRIGIRNTNINKPIIRIADRGYIPSYDQSISRLDSTISVMPI